MMAEFPNSTHVRNIFLRNYGHMMYYWKGNVKQIKICKETKCLEANIFELNINFTFEEETCRPEEQKSDWKLFKYLESLYNKRFLQKNLSSKKNKPFILERQLFSHKARQQQGSV